MRVIGYYTINTPYEEEVPDYTRSLEKYNIDYKIYPVASKRSWVANCAQKPRVIRKAIDETEDDILYLDIDARCVRKPPFEEIKGSLPGFPIFHHELLSGTLYFPNNELSRKVLDSWIAQQEKNPTMWDQKVLYKVVKEEYPKDYLKLGLHWVKIFDNSRMELNNQSPVFIHYQASRKNKRAIK